MKRSCRTLLLCLAVCGLAFSSCVNRDVSKRLSDIESYISDCPDSALMTLRNIDTTKLYGAKQKAHYSLLMSMALAKNDIDTADLSVSTPAAKYYSRHGSKYDKMRTAFYRGQQQYNGNQYDDAAISYLRALDYAKRLKDLEFQGLSYGSIAEVYSATYNYYEALSYLDQAENCFRSNGDSNRLNITICKKARQFGNMHLFNETDSLYESLIAAPDISEQLRRTALSCYAHSLAARQEHDYKKAGELYRELIAQGKGLDSWSDWGAYACCLEAAGDTKNADSIIRQLDRFGDENLNFWRARILEERGQYKEALACRDAILSTATIKKAFSQSAAIGLRDYYHIQAESVAKESRIQKLLILLGLITFLLVGLIAWFLYNRQHRKDLEERERLLGTAEAARRDLSESILQQRGITNSLSSLKAEYMRIYRTQFSQLAELYELVRAAEIRAEKKSSRPEEAVYSKIKGILKDINSDEDGQMRFEAQINSKMGDAMAHFREDFPKMNFEDYKFISCVFAGFDGITLAQIFGSTPASLRMKKSRFKKKIEDSACLRKDEYLCLF